jgi:DNA (cytosine-5)-methyltransferase 1
MRKPRLLDLYCGAGGAAFGYARAGFEVVGVDLVPQKRFPFEFHQANALSYLASHAEEFDAFHASPPCQRFSTMTARWRGRSSSHKDWIGETRDALVKTGKPFVIENVEGAPLHNPVVLCGSMFELPVPEGRYLRRHRLFEASFPTSPLPVCAHTGRAITICGHGGGTSTRDGLTFLKCKDWGVVMEIDWMTQAELAQAIPPAYTHWIGQEMLNVMGDFDASLPPV